MNDEIQQWQNQDHDQALADGSDDEYGYPPSEPDIEVGLEGSSIRRKSIHLSRDSAEDPLLEQRDSIRLDGGYREGRRTTQKIYIVTEDLTIVVAGYTTSTVGSVIMIIFSVMTIGLGYLILRWIPRWRIGLVGKPTTLATCDWMVVEVRY